MSTHEQSSTTENPTVSAERRMLLRHAGAVLGGVALMGLAGGNLAAAGLSRKAEERSLSGRIPVSATDRRRMQQLLQEMSGPMNEMARIVDGYLDLGGLNPVTKFAYTNGGTAADPEVEVLILSGGHCGVYIDPPGVCEPC